MAKGVPSVCLVGWQMDRILFGFGSHPLVWVGIDLNYPLFLLAILGVCCCLLGSPDGVATGEVGSFCPMFSLYFSLLADLNSMDPDF